MDITIANGGWSLKNLASVNIVLGKNGCGKSTMLRAIESNHSAIPDHGKVTYITPERGGALQYASHIEQTVMSGDESLRAERRRNQARDFKQQTVSQYRRLFNAVAREVMQHVDTKKQGDPETFSKYIARINTLLDQVEVRDTNLGFEIRRKGAEGVLSAEVISSGEAELIALGIEALVFEKEVIATKNNLLLLDEPDVHLHPDLQVRLMRFLWDRVKNESFRIVLATHSTAILGALSGYERVHIAFMTAGQKELVFEPIDEIYRRILPVFGAHPLSNVFNEAPLLLVEGEDDERIWQQTIRSAQGRLHFYPCDSDTVDKLTEYEGRAKRIMASVYDGAKAFSLRDGDGKHEELIDDPPVTRLRLQCYAAENLILTNEVLAALGSTWPTMKADIEVWLKSNPHHKNFQSMSDFKAAGYDRRDFKVKDLRNDFMHILGSNKPWEVAVGQAIAQLRPDAKTDYTIEGSLYTFLGKKAVTSLLA